MRCDSRREDIWLFAAGELAASECDALWSHLGVCDPCSRELAAAHRLLEGGALALQPVDAPPSIRESLLARIRAARGAESLVKKTLARRTRKRWVALATAAALGALLGGTGSALWFGQRDSDLLRSEVDAMRAGDADRRLELADLRQRFSELEGQFRPASSDDLGHHLGVAETWITPLEAARDQRVDERHLRMIGFDPRVDTSARVFCLETEELCGFRAAGLPTPAPGQSYALWLTNLVGRYYLVGTFEVDAYGSATMLASAPVAVRDVARSVVTLEPGEAGWRPMGSVVMVEGAFDRGDGDSY